MKNVTGPPVIGSDFFDRELEQAELWELLEAQSIVLLAPRRVGKTSLLLRMRDQPELGWRAQYIDVMSAVSEAHFTARLLAALYQFSPSKKTWKALGDTVSDVLDRVGAKLKIGPVEAELVEAVSDNWRDMAETALRLVAGLESKTLLLIDEFPIFVDELLSGDDGPDRTRRFLNWFRSVRQSLNLAPQPVQFVLAGSIGLDGVLRRAGLSATAADLEPFRLGPLSRQHATDLIELLAVVDGFQIDGAVIAQVLNRVSWPIPYHIQLIYRQLRRAARRAGIEAADLRASHVDAAYEDLLEGHNRVHFSHWLERLKPGLWPARELDLIKALLRAAASDPNGVSDYTVVQLKLRHARDVDPTPLLQLLEHDGYLVHSQTRWRFPSALLRDWWKLHGPTPSTSQPVAVPPAKEADS